MIKRKFKIKIEGKVFEAEVEEMGVVERNQPVAQTQTTPKTSSSSTQISSMTGNSIVAPMPGKVISIKVSKGDPVKSGDVVLVLEAMKMEQEIKATVEGTVAEITVSEGDTVKKEQVMIAFS
jgi:biotin carboxyl carrier protein